MQKAKYLRQTWFWQITLKSDKMQNTHILEQSGARVLVEVQLLLFSQVFMLGRLETHGYQLCAGQHLAPVDGNLSL